MSVYRVMLQRWSSGFMNQFGAVSRSRNSLLNVSSARHASFNVQSQEDFNDRVLKNKKPVLVDFHASWCGPCKLLGPRLEEVVAKSNEAVDLAKVDIDELADIAMYYSVSSVPTVIAIKDGIKKDQFIGLQEAEIIENMIESII